MKIELKTISIKNFKGIKDLTINFSNVTNILGENGTGKSTIFDSFNWLLFDKDSKDRGKFDIQPLDEKNNIIHMLETEVQALLNVGGKEIKLRKVLKEKWVKKRGDVESELKGTETNYYINEVPLKQSEYKSKINEMINENIFKLITNPLYFSISTKWQERREIIMKIVGDIDDVKVISSNDNLKELTKLLLGVNIDELKKSAQAKKKRLMEDKKSIPYRVDELNNSLEIYDYEGLESQKKKLELSIKEIEEKLNEEDEKANEILIEKERLYELKTKQKELEYTAKIETEKPLIKLRNELQDLCLKINSRENELNYNKQEINEVKNEIKKLEEHIDLLKDKWCVEADRIFEFNEKYYICPTCNRPLDEKDIEKVSFNMQLEFNKNQSRMLAELTQLIKENSKIIQDLNKKIIDMDLENLQNEISKLKRRKRLLELNKSNINSEVDLDSSIEYQNIRNEIGIIEDKLQNFIVTNDQAIKDKKIELQADLVQINKILNLRDVNKKIKDRIYELLDEEKKLANQIADLERIEYKCEEFIKTKVSLLEDEINNKFRYVKFKLFDKQVNGGIIECCEALIEGVPFSNANTASQYNGGIDVINALSKYYGVQAPIFIDNRESINNLIECNSQIINLIVSKDDGLKIEANES